MPTSITFGPPLPSDPNQSQGMRVMARQLGGHLDTLTVQEDVDDVAHKLGTTAAPGLVQLTRRGLGDEEGDRIYINPAHVRYIEAT